MLGDESRARESALNCKNNSGDQTRALSVLLRFHAWDDLVVFPQPNPDPSGYGKHAHAVTGFWHFSRGVALLALGRVDKAQQELESLKTDAALLPGPPDTRGTLDLEQSGENLWTLGNRGSMGIATAILTARISEARGQLAEASESLREAVRLQDELPYGEPPTWFYPVRESLGALLLKRGDSAEAEKTFREGLRLSPRDPRLLLGLSEAQRASGHATEAAATQKEFAALWKGPQGGLKVADL